MSNTPGGEGKIEGNVEKFVRWWKTFRTFYAQESLMNTTSCEKHIWILTLYEEMWALGSLLSFRG